VGDSFLSPLKYVDPNQLSYGLTGFSAVNALSFRLGDYEALKKASFDPYLAMRDIYVQSRQKAIKE